MAKNTLTMQHIRTVHYIEVDCPTCAATGIMPQRFGRLLREDYSEAPIETGSAVGDHIHEEVRKPLEEFKHTSVFFCDKCKSILHSSVIVKTNTNFNDASNIVLVWAADQAADHA